MAKRFFPVLFSVFAGLFYLMLAPAGPGPKEDLDDIQSLVRAISSADWKTREKATGRLIELAKADADRIKALLPLESEDQELALRCDSVREVMADYWLEAFGKAEGRRIEARSTRALFRKLNKTIGKPVDYSGLAIELVAHELSNDFGIEIEWHENAFGDFDVEIFKSSDGEATLAQMLDRLVERAGCQWRVKSGRILITKQ